MYECDHITKVQSFMYETQIANSASSIQTADAVYGSIPLISSSSGASSGLNSFYDSIADSYTSSMGMSADAGLYSSQGASSAGSIGGSLMSMGASSAQAGLSSLMSLDSDTVSAGQVQLMMEVNRMSVSASASMFGGIGGSSSSSGVLDLFG